MRSPNSPTILQASPFTYLLFSSTDHMSSSPILSLQTTDRKQAIFLSNLLAQPVTNTLQNIQLLKLLNMHPGFFPDSDESFNISSRLLFSPMTNNSFLRHLPLALSHLLCSQQNCIQKYWILITFYRPH